MVFLDSPEKPRPHVPNIFLQKQSKRKMEYLNANIHDDSNIEYEKIFPEIYSKNKKLSHNVSIDK